MKGRSAMADDGSIDRTLDSGEIERITVELTKTTELLQRSLEKLSEVEEELEAAK
jgi:hypothetical protein